jgi:cytochrome c oxidase subunit IV
VHFVALTAGRQTDFSVLEWPSTLYAVELLAWDIFLGLSLLCAACVFVGSGVRGYARWSLVVAGTLSLLGAIGPVVGDLAFQRAGIVGYGVGLPVAAFVLSRFFRQSGG